MTHFKRKFFHCVGALALATLSFSAHALKVGDMAPDFTLKDSTGATHKLSSMINKKNVAEQKHIVLEWFNHGCPFVVKHYESGNMQALQKEFTGKVTWLSINSTSPTATKDYQDAATTLKTQKTKGMASTAVLLDPEGTVGKAYDAVTTPHMFIIDPQGKVVYNGAIDDKPTSKVADVKTAKPLFKNALTAATTGGKIEMASNKPYGCSVKYKTN